MWQPKASHLAWPWSRNNHLFRRDYCASRPQRFLGFCQHFPAERMNHGPLTKPFGGTSQHHLPPSCLFVGRDTAVIANLEESPLTHIDFGDTHKMTPKPQHQKPILAEHQGNKSRCWILLLRRIHHKDTILRMVKCHEFKFSRTTNSFSTAHFKVYFSTR